MTRLIDLPKPNNGKYEDSFGIFSGRERVAKCIMQNMISLQLQK
jgi:hypothetical protein